MLFIGGAAVPHVTARPFALLSTHTHTHTLQGGLTAALIASWHHCNNSASFSEMIIGENPWLLSQVHYIMPASQSASRPPSTLCYVSPLWQPAVIFLFLRQSFTMSTTRNLYIIYTTYASTPSAHYSPQHPHQSRVVEIKGAPQKITLSPKEWGNVGHCDTGGNSVHTHNLFLYYQQRLWPRINDNCSLCKLYHEADNPRRLLQCKEPATPRIRP